MVETFHSALSSALTADKVLAMALFLATALGTAGFAYWKAVRERSLKDFLSFMLPTEILFHPSSKADFLFWFTNKLLAPIFRIPLGISFVAAVGYSTHRLFGSLFSIEAPLAGPAGPVTLIFFTITMLLAYDISYYLYHLAQHRIPFMWELHKVHHSAEVLVGVTKDRVHPLDDLMTRMWDGLIPGVCFGIWSLVAFDPVEVTIFGMNVYVLRNILMMDFVRHTHLKISFGVLDSIVLCPHWHQLHHSSDPRHYDKNFGLMFSFWDRWFGTLCIPEPSENFKFGLSERDFPQYQSLYGLYILPLKKMWRLLRPNFLQKRPAGSRQGSQEQ